MPDRGTRLTREKALWALGMSRVAGVDEAGRGPWAGPVVAAAVILPAREAEILEQGLLRGLTDSKKLTENARDRYYDRLTSKPEIAWRIACVEAPEIDRLRIHRATYKAMREALTALNPLPDIALVDGRPVPGLPCRSESVIRGDALCLSISAASVLAKVTRDRIMREADQAYPGYGFARHKGYGTAAHREALQRKGPCPLHRRSFAPVAALMTIPAASP